MSAFKVIFTVLFASLFLIKPDFTKAGINSTNKAEELNSQIKEEITDILQTPYLKFVDKNLNGYVKVVSTVNSDGRIIFKEIKGINNDLLSNVISKLNSLNLWTSPDYSGKNFTYNIRYRN